MFVYYYVHVPRPAGEVEQLIVERFDRLDGWAKESYREGEAIRARLGVGRGEPILAKDVLMRVGEPIHTANETLIPLEWEATGATALFPRMEAHLVVAPLGESLTQVEFRGTYEPPLGPLGRVIDRAVLHRVAETTVKAFVDKLGAALAEAELDASSSARDGTGEGSDR